MKVGCVTSITGLTVPKDQIDTTCLEDQAASSIGGLARPGAANFTIAFDPQDASHIRIHELFVTGEVLDWAIGLSDGASSPTSESTGWTTPTDRSWVLFEGYLSDVPFDIALNSVVTSNVGIQTSGFPEVIPKTT